nr:MULTISPECIES: WPE palindromic element domain-containing protein [unclassified Wolbachia]
MIKLCNKAGSQCRSTQLYERCDMGVTSTKNDVIPVPRHWDPENLIVNEHTRWLYSKSWIPVSSTGMTTRIIFRSHVCTESLQ